MASTKTLQNTIDFASGFIFNKPVANASNEPAITIANTIKQTILGAPFTWRWNRATTTVTCIIGTQDYAKALGTFGWIEKASVQDPATSKWFEIKPLLSLGLDSASARPLHIAPWGDDNAGNITFRLMPVPDKIYPVSITVQQKATLFTALTGNGGTWAPIPDEFSYVYNWGFLALVFLYSDDPRFSVANQKFISALLSASEGLDETQKNIFINSWTALTGQVNASAVGQGTHARAV